MAVVRLIVIFSLLQIAVGTQYVASSTSATSDASSPRQAKPENKLMRREIQKRHPKSAKANAAEPATSHKHGSKMSNLESGSGVVSNSGVRNPTEWWSASPEAGPPTVTTHDAPSNTLVAVFLTGSNGKQLACVGGNAATLSFVDTTDESTHWNIVDSGENHGTVYIQTGSAAIHAAAGGEGDSLYLADTGAHHMEMSVSPYPWKLEVAAGGKIKIKSAIHGNYLLEDGAVTSSSTSSSASAEFVATVISIGWGKHSTAGVVSPTSVQVFISGFQSGNSLKVESSTALLSTTSWNTDEVWTIIDTGRGYNYLRSAAGGYLRDDRGTLEISDWSGVGDTAKEWWISEEPAGHLVLVKFTGKSGRDLLEHNGVPGLSTDSSLHSNQFVSDNKKFKMTLHGVNFQLDRSSL